MAETTTGLLLLFIAGVMNASFTLPMKFTRRWAWENTWLIWTIFALVLLPPVITLLTVEHVGQVYAEAGTSLILTVAAFGAGWGVAQVLFGLAVEVIGIALTFSIVLGMSAAIGSMIPLVRLDAWGSTGHCGCCDLRNSWTSAGSGARAVIYLAKRIILQRGPDVRHWLWVGGCHGQSGPGFRSSAVTGRPAIWNQFCLGTQRCLAARHACWSRPQPCLLPVFIGQEQNG